MKEEREDENNSWYWFTPLGKRFFSAIILLEMLNKESYKFNHLLSKTEITAVRFLLIYRKVRLTRLNDKAIHLAIRSLVKRGFVSNYNGVCGISKKNFSSLHKYLFNLMNLVVPISKKLSPHYPVNKSIRNGLYSINALENYLVGLFIEQKV